jgi:hypothetical protein
MPVFNLIVVIMGMMVVVTMPVIKIAAGLNNGLRGTHRQTEMAVPTAVRVAVHSRSVTVQQRISLRGVHYG